MIDVVKVVVGRVMVVGTVTEDVISKPSGDTDVDVDATLAE